MKGFKPTGYGPSAGFKYPAHMGFTGSTGTYVNVRPHVRHFANGGYVRKEIGDQGSALIRRERSSNNLDQESGGKTPVRPGYKKGGRMKKADGGPVEWVDRRYRVPRRYSDPTIGEGLRAIPPLAKEMASAMTRGTRRAFGPKERRFGREGELASNYAKGGKAKRMGYSNGGGRRDGAITTGGGSTPKQSKAVRAHYATSAIAASSPASESKGDMKRRMLNAQDRIMGTFTPEKKYRMQKAKGGTVSASEAKKIAERTVGDHVRYPAPKGHKGLEKAMRR